LTIRNKVIRLDKEGFWSGIAHVEVSKRVLAEVKEFESCELIEKAFRKSGDSIINEREINELNVLAEQLWVNIS